MMALLRHGTIAAALLAVAVASPAGATVVTGTFTGAVTLNADPSDLRHC